ncbi:MAG TPA: hypothetical protein VGB76_13745 [Pyrinomonadaceae bacterium]
MSVAANARLARAANCLLADAGRCTIVGRDGASVGGELVAARRQMFGLEPPVVELDETVGAVLVAVAMSDRDDAVVARLRVEVRQAVQLVEEKEAGEDDGEILAVSHLDSERP